MSLGRSKVSKKYKEELMITVCPVGISAVASDQGGNSLGDQGIVDENFSSGTKKKALCNK